MSVVNRVQFCRPATKKSRKKPTATTPALGADTDGQILPVEPGEGAIPAPPMDQTGDSATPAEAPKV